MLSGLVVGIHIFAVIAINARDEIDFEFIRFINVTMSMLPMYTQERQFQTNR